MYQHLPLQDPPKFTQNGIFGLKIYHLATLLVPLFPMILFLFTIKDDQYILAHGDGPDFSVA
jgi:hypothetical protein